jgi:DHA1 family multidrug resistance protein-like MFS transporter
VCYGTFVSAFDSGLFAPGGTYASEEFGVSRIVGLLGTSLFMLGFFFGPIIWAPGSEVIGRRWPLLIGMLGLSIFTIGAATAANIQTLIICRFFSGVCGVSPLCVVPGVLADMYNNVWRGVAVTLYALTIFLGPLAAPFMGGFISMSSLGWRWTLYIPAILGFIDVLLILAFVDESYVALILTEKAVEVRKETGNWAIHSRQERIEFNPQEMVRKYFTRPIKMLFTEPIVFLVSLYMSFIYGIVYALLVAYPYVFEEIYDMNPGVRGLPFLGLITGVVLAVVVILALHGTYANKLKLNNDVPIPEWRLEYPIIGAPIFTIGLFW